MFQQSPITKRFINVFQELKEKQVFKSNSAFAKSLLMSPQGLNEIIKGRRDVTISALYRLFKTYKIDPSLLFIDEIFEASQKERSSQNEEPLHYIYEKYNIKIHSIVVDKEDNERVVLVDKKASAGYLKGFQDENFIKGLPTVSLPPGLEHKSLYAFEVEGDSMEANIYDGDWAFCSLLEKLEWVRLNRVYVIICEEGIVVKRITGINNKKITVSSDNEIYPPYTIPLPEVKQIWYLEKTLRGKFPMADAQIENRVNKLEDRMEQIIYNFIKNKK